MKFELSKEQIEKVLKWKKTLPKEPKTAIGGSLTYCFTQTSLGVVTVVECFNGEKLDVTPYEDW